MLVNNITIPESMSVGALHGHFHNSPTLYCITVSTNMVVGKFAHKSRTGKSERCVVGGM